MQAGGGGGGGWNGWGPIVTLSNVSHFQLPDNDHENLNRKLVIVLCNTILWPMLGD